jgi:hypothetical protein
MVNPVPTAGPGTPYGRRGPYWSCDRDSAGNGIHTGQDFPASSGTTVVAARPGTARYCSHGSAFGSHQLEVRAGDGTRDFYAHMRSRAVADGAKVQAGQKVGEVGAEGNVTGPHLHFERHATETGGWSCSVVRDPTPSINYQPASTGGSGSGSSTGKDDEDMPTFAHARCTKPIKLKADEWTPITWDTYPDSAKGLFDSNGQGIKAAGKTYSATLAVRVDGRGGGNLQTSWVERKGGETQETSPVASHGGVDNAVETRNGSVGKDRTLRARVRVTGKDATLKSADLNLLLF